MKTNKELADGLEVPSSRITEWIKRGMPRDSIQAATSWRLVHARPRKGNAAIVAQSRQDKPGDHAPGKATPATDDGWEARLSRCRKTEMEIFDTLRKALAQGDVNMLGKLQAAHVASIKEIAAAEKIALEVRLATKELIHRETVQAIMRELLSPLRDALDKLPVSERTNCNSANPQEAEEALTIWRDRLMARAYAAENRFTVG